MDITPRALHDPFLDMHTCLIGRRVSLVLVDIDGLSLIPKTERHRFA